MKKLLYGIVLSFLPSLSFGAWTSVGSFGRFSQNASTTAWTVTSTATLEVGNVAVCIWASDNNGDGTDTNDFTTMTDTAGNTWVSVGENEANPGAKNAGAVVGIFYTLATVELSTGMYMTINNTTAETARAGTCHEFTVQSNAVVTSTGTEQKEDSTGDAGPLTLGSLGSGEHLWIRGMAAETGNGDISIVSVSWSKIAASNLDTGTEATSMSAVGEYRILSATTATSDPTMNDTTADRASSLIALNEAKASSVKRVIVVP